MHMHVYTNIIQKVHRCDDDDRVFRYLNGEVICDSKWQANAEKEIIRRSRSHSYLHYSSSIHCCPKLLLNISRICSSLCSLLLDAAQVLTLSFFTLRFSEKCYFVELEEAFLPFCIFCFFNTFLKLVSVLFQFSWKPTSTSISTFRSETEQIDW